MHVTPLSPKFTEFSAAQPAIRYAYKGGLPVPTAVVHNGVSSDMVAPELDLAKRLGKTEITKHGTQKPEGLEQKVGPVSVTLAELGRPRSYLDLPIIPWKPTYSDKRA